MGYGRLSVSFFGTCAKECVFCKFLVFEEVNIALSAVRAWLNGMGRGFSLYIRGRGMFCRSLRIGWLAGLYFFNEVCMNSYWLLYFLREMSLFVSCEKVPFLA